MTLPWRSSRATRSQRRTVLILRLREPGRRARITYASWTARHDRRRGHWQDPLAARGHVIPGAELYKGQARVAAEQFMQ